jgi:1,4-dihydroxy-2-naphthoate octaprenyltransferase
MKKSSINIFDRDTLVHLRLPFSFFLLPVYLFALSQSESINWYFTGIIFISLHFFIYPASNIYNSFMDDDKGSIGGLKNPPPVTKKLFYASIVFDGIGLILCFLTGYKMVLLMIVYILISKAYSWKKIRLKKYAYTGWLVVMLFQGGYTYLLVNMATENNFSSAWFNSKNIMAMLLASVLIGAYYPLTQIYQHEEDSNRGDYTISYRLGIMGTFIFSAVLFGISAFIARYYFLTFYSEKHFVIFIACLLPAIIHFFYWLLMVRKNHANADFHHAMRMTFISSGCLIICYGLFLYLKLKQ